MLSRYTFQPLQATLTLSWQYIQRLLKPASDPITTASVATPEIKRTPDLPSFSNLKVEHQIGSGEAAKVYQGKWNDETVAIKIMPNVADFIAESTMMETLNSLSSPYIVKYHGHRRDSMHASYCLIMEYLQHGTVSALLQSHQSTPLPWASCYNILESTAAGIRDMHQAHIAHGDLKWNNVALTDDDQTKLFDFGLSMHVNATPKPFSLTTPDLKNDIRLFGCMIEEIIEYTPKDDKKFQALAELASECKNVTQTMSAATLYQKVHELCEKYALENGEQVFRVDIRVDKISSYRTANTSGQSINFGLFPKESISTKANELTKKEPRHSMLRLGAQVV